MKSFNKCGAAVVCIGVITLTAVVILTRPAIVAVQHDRLSLRQAFQAEILSEDRCVAFAEGDVLLGDNGQPEVIALLGSGVLNDCEGLRFAERLVVYRATETGQGLFKKKVYQEAYSLDLKGINPWTLAVGEMDGDGIPEIFIGAYKVTPFFKSLGKRPFLFSFDGNKLYKKWTGSSLAYPDFGKVRLVDTNGDGLDELVVKEGALGALTVDGIYRFANWSLVRQ